MDLIFIVLLVVLVAGAVSYWWFFMKKKAGGSKAPEMQQQTQDASAGDVDTVVGEVPEVTPAPEAAAPEKPREENATDATDTK